MGDDRNVELNVFGISRNKDSFQNENFMLGCRFLEAELQDMDRVLSGREIWKRHKKKVYFTIGVLGSGYLLYKLYDAHKRRLSDLERELAQERENDELIKAHMQAHFGNIQRIADTATLPHSMLYLSSRVVEELDLLHLTEQLIRGKGQSNSLSSSEKLELCFTRMVLSLWAMTMLSLYIRVQVNILGRHLYIDTARDLGSSHLLVKNEEEEFSTGHLSVLMMSVKNNTQPPDSKKNDLMFMNSDKFSDFQDEADLIDRNDQQQFLASADFLSNYGMPTLISNMQAAASEVLKGTVDGIAHGVISLTGRISDINFKAEEFPTLSNTTGLVDSVVYLVDAYNKKRFAEAKKELDALHKKQQQY
ncbi:unnamed protein product [Camellia sinensis]